MARYIERELLLNALKEEREKGNFVFTSKWIKEIMDKIPTADVVPKSEVDWHREAELNAQRIIELEDEKQAYVSAEDVASVVRCKDCNKYLEYFQYCYRIGLCKPNDYCSRGERRKEDAVS